MNSLEHNDLAWDILESVGSLLVADLNNNIIFISKTCAEFFHTTPEKCIGLPVNALTSRFKMDNYTQRAQKGDIAPENYLASRSGNLRRIVGVFRNGESSPENLLGSASFNILNSSIDTQSNMDQTIASIESLILQNSTYQNLLTEVYTADRELDDILGSSAGVRTVKALIGKVAPSNVSVCVLGETGVGKELVGDAIHNLSKRADKPFVKINCAAIPRELMESELFGYAPGAFTGASRNGKIGKFELANGGTLLLDEIGELPLSMQAKLLRVLQSQEIERLGGTKPIPIDVRLICSTNRDLRRMVADGTFRADLYYRINTMEIEIPPLRERKEDIPLLVNHFIEASNRRNGLSITGISEGAVHYLLSLQWPGNVRELENAVERSCVLCGEGEIDVSHFSFLISSNLQTTQNQSSVPPFLRHLSPAEERTQIVNALNLCGGKKTAAAKLLGIPRSSFYLKLEKYAIK